ncbi:MAG: malate synthase A [Myxococcota bacterium]
MNAAPLAGVELRGPQVTGSLEILTDDALAFVAQLVRSFRPRIHTLLDARREQQARFDAGKLPAFADDTLAIRQGDWRVGPLPDALLDRRVEITGPVDRKMIINALNSGARVFMADFEDSSSPTWANMVGGQLHLRDAVRRTISYTHPKTGKTYRLNADNLAVLMVRPRGLHLSEAHLLVDGAPVPGSLFDFGLYFFHNAQALLERGHGPYFYLPKLESHHEAAMWNDVFVAAQQALGIAVGTIKATVLIETLPAAFQMDEILYALRGHSAGLNCGRWDYIFSYIKTTRSHAQFLLPDRGQVGMTQPFMRAYTTLAVQTCHRRGVHAMGGMAAQIPIKGDPAANAAAFAKVRIDKAREAADGHDGTWVAHPGLIETAMQAFHEKMPGANQIDRASEAVRITDAALLTIPTGTRTEAGLRQNINVGVLYIESWLRGKGCVPLYNLMEDAATAEISRAQVWQWVRHGAALDDGRVISAALVAQMLDEELTTIRGLFGDKRFETGRFPEASRLFSELVQAETCPDFLTLAAYPLIQTTHP